MEDSQKCMLFLLMAGPTMYTTGPTNIRPHLSHIGTCATGDMFLGMA